MTTMDTQTNSITTKRGRPPKLVEGIKAFVRSTWQENSSERSVNNGYYRMWAMRIIKKSPCATELTWVFDFNKTLAGGKAWKPSLLTELGRIQDEDELLAMAKELCRVKPKTKAGIAMIRNYRLGIREPKPFQLHDEIAHAINDYWKRFPNMTKAHVVDTLQAVIEGVAE